MNSQDRLGEHIAEVLLSSAGGSQPPTDLRAVADLLRVGDIRLTTLAEEGRLIREGGGWAIELRHDRPSTRQRFTLAHELGHAAVAKLEQDDLRVRYRARRGEDAAEERLCDWIAAALLMPRAWLVEQTAFQDDLTLSRLRLMAHRANVSLAAAVVRLAELDAHRCMLLRCRRGPAGWSVLGRAAVPSAWGPRVRFGATAQTLLPTRRGCHSVLVPVSTDQGDVQVAAQFDVVGEAATFLVPDAHLHWQPS